MDITSSSKQQVLAALVVGVGASVAHADLGALQVVESSSNGFEAVVNLSNQTADQIANVEVVDGTQAGAQANTAAASLLQVALLGNEGTDNSLNHQIKITGPGSISSEALRFALAVNYADGGRLIRNYEVMPVVAPGADALMAMTEFQEVETAGVSATKVVPPTVDKPVQIAVNKAKPEKVMPISADAGLVVGDVKVKSTMGQKLALEFDVAGKNIQNADDIQVQVLPDLSLGVITPEVAMDIATMQYEVVKKGNGRYSVLLTSMVTMNEPILPVKVEITAGGDVMEKQYSVLVDPPRMNQSPQKASTYLAYDEPNTVSQLQRRSSGKVAKGAKGYQVVEGDTLAGIASQIKAKSPLSEKMRYLLDANPHAFVGDDINKLRAGTTLNFPATWSMVGTPVRQPSVAVASSASNISMVETVAEHQAANNSVVDTVAANTAIEDDLSGNTQMGDEAAPIQELTANQFKAQQLREQLAEQQQAIVAAQSKIDAARQQKEANTATVSKDDSMIALVGDINPVLAGGGVAALALVGGGMVLMRRRKQKQEQMFDDEDMEYGLGESLPDPTYSFGLDDDVSLDEINYVSEVDSLMSYGHFDQAVVLLREALTQAPDNSELSLKLFEVLAVMGNSEAFQQEALASQENLRNDHALFEKVTQLALSLNPVPAYFTGEESNQSKTDKDSDLAFGI